MADETNKPAANVPPKLNLKQTGAITPVDPASQSVPTKLDLHQTLAGQNVSTMPKKATTRIDMAAAAMIPEEKSKTTRINLGTLGADASLAPKTIKIQRPSEASTIKLNRPTPSPAAPPPASQQTKRQTSRISLQEAFSAQVEGHAPAPQTAPGAEATPPAGPKTIRIKRPGDGVTSLGTTAGADTAESPDSEAGPPTQRKTIKLKRPGGGDVESGRLAVTLPKAAADFAAAQAAGESTEDEPGATFGILSLVATLVCAVLIYLLCVQALPSLGLSWPGQVPTIR